MAIDRSAIELAVFGTNSASAEALLCLPEDESLHRLRLERDAEGFVLKDDPFEGQVTFTAVRAT